MNFTNDKKAQKDAYTIDFKKEAGLNPSLVIVVITGSYKHVL